MKNISMVNYSLEAQKLFDQQQRKAIPSKMWFNHFYAIHYHLECCSDKYNLKKNEYFNNIKIKNQNFNIDYVRKLLWNSWSTEYAFLISNHINSDDYYKFSFHWNFPQAYYAVYLTMTAFHETQGVANDQHEKSIKLFGNSIKDNHYPSTISFFAKDAYESFSYNGLNQFKGFNIKFSGLSKIDSLEEAHTQIAMFLKSTRIKNAEHKREKLEKANDKQFHNKDGKFRKTFKKAHWDLIYKSIPETTILNILYRLRIKANYHDVESFINADIDFKIFHKCLASIIDYLNFVHEAYIVKAIGEIEYKIILNGFPSHLNKDTAIKRYSSYIVNSFPQ